MYIMKLITFQMGNPIITDGFRYVISVLFLFLFVLAREKKVIRAALLIFYTHKRVSCSLQVHEVARLLQETFVTYDLLPMESFVCSSILTRNFSCWVAGRLANHSVFALYVTFAILPSFWFWAAEHWKRLYSCALPILYYVIQCKMWFLHYNYCSLLRVRNKGNQTIA